MAVSLRLDLDIDGGGNGSRRAMSRQADPCAEGFLRGNVITYGLMGLEIRKFGADAANPWQPLFGICRS
jgi:hypothetical protein